MSLILTFYLTFFLVYIYIYTFWHSMWHSIWHLFWHSSGIPSGIYSDILSGIFSGIHSGILSGICSDILSELLSGVVSDIISGVWLRSGSAHWALELAVEVRQCPLISGACGWGRGGEEEKRSRDPHLAGGEKQMKTILLYFIILINSLKWQQRLAPFPLA